MKDPLHMHKALKYAADMKRLEEQGRVIILPYKINKETKNKIINYVVELEKNNNEAL